jgi:FkbH-like protein
MKIAFLTTYNSDFLKKEFEKYLRERYYKCELWWNAFGTHEQAVFDKSSSLFEFNPDLIFIHYETETLLGDIAFDPLSENLDFRKGIIKSCMNKITSIVNDLLNSFPKSNIVIENFIPRDRSNLGTLDINTDLGLYEIVNELNDGLFSIKKHNPTKIFINNYHELISEQGKVNCFDFRMYHLGKYPFTKSFLPDLFNHYEAIINIFSFPRKKCIVVDLDNTLWGGIIGQDGIDKIELGGNGIGESYVQFQKTLLNFYRKGIFLAICSKNNYDDALEVLEKHPDMILRKKYFSSLKINWTDKASNLRSIAEELNIGIDSLVFLDDNPAECELVKQQLPEVEVILLSGDPNNYIKQAMKVSSIQTVFLTDEDLSRNQMKQADDRRKEYEIHFTSLDEFYKSLEMQADIWVDEESHISRIAQLTQKTNQFNLTTRRYSSDEIREFINNREHRVYTLRLTDKFGDNGIALIAIVGIVKEGWHIESFLMSCRIIGRQAETALLNSIIDDAAVEGVKIVSGEFIPTKKNAPASSFYSDHNFTRAEGNLWKLQLPTELTQHHIKIIRNTK